MEGNPAASSPAGGQGQTSTGASNATVSPVASHAKPAASQIATRFSDAEDPLAFVRNNLQQRDVTPVPPPTQPAAATPPPQQNGAQPIPVPPPSQSAVQQRMADLSFDTQMPPTSPQQQADPVVPPTEKPRLPDDVRDLLSPMQDKQDERQQQDATTPEDEKDPKSSIRNLRRKANELTTQLTEKEQTIEQLKADIEKYKSGEATPDIIQKKDERIKQLEHFEKLHNFKNSAEYQREYVVPYNNLNEKLLSIAKDYQVSNEVLNEALSIENRRDLNAFLKQHFDDIGASEVRDIVTKMREVWNASQAAEKVPEESLQDLQSRFAQEERVREEQRINEITNNSKSGWSSALADITSKGEYPELILKEGDEAHNAIARPLVEQAATEFGKLVKILHAHGLKELPAPVANILAKRFALSQAAAVISASRADHYNRSERIIQESRSTAPFIHPPIGGNGGGSLPAGGGGAARPKTGGLEATGEKLINDILSRSR